MFILIGKGLSIWFSIAFPHILEFFFLELVWRIMGLSNFILDVTFTFTSDFPLFGPFVLCSERLTFQSLMPSSSAYSAFQFIYPPLRPIMFLFLRFIKTLFHNCSFSELSLFRDCHIFIFVYILHFSYNVGLFSWSFTGFHTWSFIFVSHEAAFFF